MRSMKKIFALALVVMMLFACAVVNVSAEDTADYSYAAQRLASINVMKGDEKGNLMLDQGVTRYQAALFFVQALTGETTVEKWNADKQSEVFSDVFEYGTAIDYANGIGLIRGRGEGVYGYNDPITYQDMLVLAVRALGYETEEMSYPYGYITAAEKLKLTENLAEGITNTQALTRGETAQIIWDMLSNTYVAIKDPVTNKILYPDDYSVGGAMLNVSLDRTTLLEEAGFSSAVIESEIVEYNPAETSKDVAHVVLKNGMEISCADLGITARTNPSTFLGLPVTLYVDSASEAEFEKDYSIVADESEANIIFADMLSFTNVKNIGDEGNIKVTANTSGVEKITLGEASFSADKYEFDVRVLTEDGWESEDFEIVSDAFFFENKEYTGINSYGEIDYAVTENEEGAEFDYKVIMLYKPYEFGQYFTRSIRYQPLVSDESFITIGTYDGSVVKFNDGGAVDGNSYENPDGDYTYFVETFLGSGASVMKDADNVVTSVSRSDGEAAREAKISGGSVRGGDFIFYYYNVLDNVIVIGKNCGGLKGGTLKSYSASKETVKIDDTTYEYGFAGVFANDLPDFEDHNFSSDYISNVGADDNVEYVAVDGKVIYLQKPLNLSGHRSKHNYVITTTDPEIMAELLGLGYSETNGVMDANCQYARKLTADGIYVSDNGNMTIAVLNTSTGKWGLAEVSQFEYGTYRSSTDTYDNYYDHKEGVWADYEYTTTDGTLVPEGKAKGKTVNMTESITNYDVFGETFKGYDAYELARDLLLEGGMFAVRQNASGVYKLSVMFTTGDYGMINNGLVVDGLYFSDTAPKTNAIKAVRSDTDPARVTINANTVIVVVGPDGTVGVRTGIQGEENSIVLKYTSDTDSSVTTAEKEKIPAFFYSASSKLIVLRLPIDADCKAYGNNSEGKENRSETITVEVTDIDGNPFDIKAWEGDAAAGADETYYVGLNNAGVEYERLDDGTYELTVSGLYNLRTMRAVSAIKLNVDDLDETDIEDVNLVGEVLEMDKYGVLRVIEKDPGTALTEAVNMRYEYSSTDDERYFEITDPVEFVDDSSITVTIGEHVLNKKDAVAKINVTVATLDVTEIDWEDFDINDIAYAVDYDEEQADEWGAGSTQYSSSKTDKYYEYVISDLNATENITEPVAGVLDQYIIDTMGGKLLVAAVDGEYYEDAAEVTVRLYACGQFDEDTGVVNVYVLKVLTSVDA